MLRYVTRVDPEAISTYRPSSQIVVAVLNPAFLRHSGTPEHSKSIRPDHIH